MHTPLQQSCLAKNEPLPIQKLKKKFNRWLYHQCISQKKIQQCHISFQRKKIPNTFNTTGNTYKEVSWLRSRSTRRMFGYKPAHSAAFTTAQFSELELRSRMSPPPRARTKPDARSWPSSWVLTTTMTRHLQLQRNSLYLSQKRFHYLRTSLLERASDLYLQHWAVTELLPVRTENTLLPQSLSTWSSTFMTVFGYKISPLSFSRFEWAYQI